MNRDDVAQLCRIVLDVLERPPANAIGERDRDPAEDLAHAKSYADTAAVLTRRAVRKQKTAEQIRKAAEDLSAEGEDGARGLASAEDLEAQARDELRRAADFGERARIVSEGEVMPRRLRTPAESLDLVDGYRHVLAEIVAALEAFADLDVEELTSFCAAAKLESPAEPLAEGLAVARVWAMQSLTRLGVTFDEQKIRFAPFRSPLSGIALPEGLAESTLEGDPTRENGV
jgi:hypothetical protein